MLKMKIFILVLIIIAILIANNAFASGNIVIIDFEGDSYGDWTPSGTAFGSSPSAGTLPNQMPVSGFNGYGLANSYVGTDQSTGSLVSPEFAIERNYINFLIGGGYIPGKACVDLIVDGKIERTATGSNSEKLMWASWDVKDMIGKNARIEIKDYAVGGWGHILADRFVLSDRRFGKLHNNENDEVLYEERYRPQFHFAADRNWINDPNGLVYYDGIYHLFFQHNPDGIDWGNMTWGHAISKDMVNWKQIDDALLPDEKGMMFSGSAVVDKNNTSGLKKGKKDVILAFYTSAGNPTTQCLAYSNDSGMTLIKYAGNPIIKHIVGDNRDPKVIWYEPDKKWIMVLFMDGSQYAFFESKDAINWTKIQDFSFPDHSECPDFFPLRIEGTDETKWIFTAANGDYHIGSFDGKVFTSESGMMKADFGTNYYAVQTYSDEPKGRRIQMAWMAGGSYPGMPFNQQMNFPAELRLIREDGKLRIVRMPIAEIKSLYDEKFSVSGRKLDADIEFIPDISGRQLDIDIDIDTGDASEIEIRIGEEKIVWIREKNHLRCLDRDIPLRENIETLRMRVLVDRASIEIFADGGRSVMTSCYLPAESDGGISLISKGRSAKIKSLKIHTLKSIWSENK